MSKNSWITFPDVNERYQEEITMGWSGMPAGFDDESLQLNVMALHKGVIRWGGYEALTLGAYKGEEDDYSHQVGHDAAGNAYSTGVATVTKAERSTHFSADDSHRNMLDMRSGRLGIQWNINALNRSIELADQYDPKVRAAQLSKEISRQAVGAVIKHNVRDPHVDRPGLLRAFYGFADGFALYACTSSLAQEEFQAVATLLGTRSVVLVGLVRALRAMQLNARGEDAGMGDFITDPFIFSARPSRAAVAASILATKKLVRPTPLKYL